MLASMKAVERLLLPVLACSLSCAHEHVLVCLSTGLLQHVLHGRSAEAGVHHILTGTAGARAVSTCCELSAAQPCCSMACALYMRILSKQ